MNKPLSRRFFMRAAAAAPVALQEAAVGLAVQATPAALAGASLGAPMSFGTMILMNPTLAALKKAGLLPSWAERQVKDELKERSRFMAADVASLKSVSLSGKFAISHARLERNFEESWSERATEMLAQRAFWGSDEGQMR